MDPNAALQMAADADYHISDRISALIGLGEWIARGGSFPTHDPAALDRIGSVDWAEACDYSGEQSASFDAIAMLHNGIDK